MPRYIGSIEMVRNKEIVFGLMYCRQQKRVLSIQVVIRIADEKVVSSLTDFR